MTFTNSNNASIVTEYNVDYQIPSEQKIGVTTSYTTGVSGKPFTKDFPNALKIGKKLYGATYRFAFMNVDTFEKFAAQDEVYKKCATFVQNVFKKLKPISFSTLSKISCSDSIHKSNSIRFRSVISKFL